MAITVDLISTYGAASYKSYQGNKETYLASFEVDFASTGNALAQNEILRITTLPAGSAIKSAMVQVVTAESEITDIDIGVTTGTSTVANIFDGISLASTGWLAANNLTATYGGTYQTAVSNILITNKDAQTLNAAKIRVVLEVASYVTAI